MQSPCKTVTALTNCASPHAVPACRLPPTERQCMRIVSHELVTCHYMDLGAGLPHGLIRRQTIRTMPTNGLITPRLAEEMIGSRLQLRPIES